MMMMVVVVVVEMAAPIPVRPESYQTPQSTVFTTR